MTKQKISSKLVDARTLAIYALDHFIDYIRTLDPELKLDEATVIAAMALQNLPQLFIDNPDLVNRTKKIAATVKRKARKAQHSMN